MQLPIYINDFLSYLETIKNKSPNTIRAYRYDLISFLRFMVKYKELNTEDEANLNIFTVEHLKQITLPDCYKYLEYLDKEVNNVNNSRARRIACLNTFFKWAKEKSQIIKENIVSELDYPKHIKHLPKYLSLNESKNLLNAVEGKNSIRDFAIITLFLNCGLRLSELCNLNMNCYKDDTIRVIGKGDKEREIHLNNACLLALENYLKIRPKINESAIFLNKNKRRISPLSVHTIVKHYITMSGLDSIMYSSHSLRHTAATLMHKYGKVDILALQEILGHKHLTTTEIYTHLDKDELRDAVDRHPLNKV